MASIPSNGYAQVMAGANNYSGSNSYDGSCPKTAIPPVVGNDLCNKTYVDTAAGGGIIGSLTDKGSLITANGTNAVIFDQNPYQSALTTTTVYDWNSLAVAQSRTFTTTVPTLLPLGATITITYSGTDNIKGTITAIAGTTITLTITALASATYTPAVLLTTTAPDTSTFAGAVFTGQTFPLAPATTTPPSAQIPAFSMITSGTCNVFQNAGGGGNFLFRLLGTGVQRPDSSIQALPLVAIGVANPTSLTWSGTNGGCFYNSATAQIPLPLIDLIAPSPPLGADFQYPIGGGFVPPNYCGQLTGYALSYGTGAITIDDDIALIADPVSATGLSWGVINTGSIGAVNSVVGGTNIIMSGTLSTPVVNLRNPLTAELNVGTQSLRDRTGAVGTSGQVLTAGTGGQVLWGANGVSSITATPFANITIDNSVPSAPTVGVSNPCNATLALGTQNITGTTGNLNFVDAGFGSEAQVKASTGFSAYDATTPATACNLTKAGLTCQSSADTTLITNNSITKTVGTNPLTISTTSASAPITITPVAGQDCNVVVSGAGGLHIQQATTGGSANPSVRITNSNASTGGVNVDLYKNRTGATNDIVSALNFYGKDLSGNKTQFGGIESVITSAGGGGGVDGALDFYSCVNGGKSLVFRMNGADNENNSFRPLDMNGNNIVTNSGNMTITTSASTGTGNMTLTSKGAMSQTATSFSLSAPVQSTFTSPLELHSGKITTNSTQQVYTPLYQPLLNISTATIPVSEIQVEGQQVSLINSRGDGGNELAPIPSPNFTITSMIYLSTISSYIAGGYNQIQNRAEIRCASTVNNLLDVIGSFNFNYIAFPTAGNYINVVYYNNLIPNMVAVGGNFSAGTTDLYDGVLPFPSSVGNFLVVDATSSVIAPTNMNDTVVGYGVNGEVKTINCQSNTYYTPASASIYILGGSFTDIIGGSTVTTERTAVYTPTGTIAPITSRWNTFIPANNTVNIIYVLDERVVFGGEFSNIGGVGNSYLAFSDSTTAFPQTSLINGFTPPAAVSAGIQVYNPSVPSYLAYFGTYDTATTPAYPVYEFDMSNMGATPALYESSLPAVPLGFGCDTDVSPEKLNYIYGHNGGGTNYLFDVLTPHFIDLNGATHLQGFTFFDTVYSPNLPYFFRQPSLTTASPLEFYIYSPTGAGAVSITTTTAYHFINPATPNNKYLTITLAAYNNFAIGTVVRLGTDDTGILIYAQNGATFSNPV